MHLCRDAKRAPFVAAIACASLLLASASSVFAQAWTPPQGLGSVAFSYNFTDVGMHLFSVEATGDEPLCQVTTCEGNGADMGEIRGNTISLYADYGIWRRLAASASVAYVSSTYDGDFPESAIDAGRNSEFQDWGVAVRYSALVNPVVVTPFIGYAGPTHNYHTVGHTAVGAGLDAFQVGINVGRGLNPWISGAYVHVNYAYSFVEDVDQFNMDSSSLNMEAGYFIKRTVGLRFLAQGFWVHDGFDWVENADLFEHSGHIHDQSAQARLWRLGGGVSYPVTRRFDVTASYLDTIWGQNTHDARGFVVSTIFNF